MGTQLTNYSTAEAVEAKLDAVPILLVEAPIASSGPNTATGVPYVGGGHPPMGGYWGPNTATINVATAWNDGTKLFTAPSTGEYLVSFPANQNMTTAGHPMNRHSATYFQINGTGYTVMTKDILVPQGHLFSVHLTLGDTMALGYYSKGHSAAPSPIHSGPLFVGGVMRIWKMP